MASRVILVVLTAFWIAMNVLLYRAEYGQKAGTAGSIVPTQMVWKKILTAPDSSSLTVLHHGVKIGFCQWLTRVVEGVSRLQEDDDVPEGMVEREAGYRIAVEGNVALEEPTQRARFEGSLKLGPKRRWQELNARVSLRPYIWEVHSVFAERTLRLRSDDGEGRLERVIHFSEMEHPEELVRELIGPWAPTILRGFGWSPQAAGIQNFGMLMAWEAREDTVRFGHSLLKAYRLRTRLIERYEITIFVSRVGEILRVELPDEVLLLNDQLSNL